MRGWAGSMRAGWGPCSAASVQRHVFCGLACWFVEVICGCGARGGAVMRKRLQCTAPSPQRPVPCRHWQASQAVIPRSGRCAPQMMREFDYGAGRPQVARSHTAVVRMRFHAFGTFAFGTVRCRL